MSKLNDLKKSKNNPNTPNSIDELYGLGEDNADTVDNVSEETDSVSEETLTTKDTNIRKRAAADLNFKQFIKALEEREDRKNHERLQAFVPLEQKLVIERIVAKMNELSRRLGKKPTASISTVIRFLITDSAVKIEKMVDKEIESALD